MIFPKASKKPGTKTREVQENNSFTEEKLEYKENKDDVKNANSKSLIVKFIFNIREAIWYYPRTIEKIANSTKPLSYILIYALLFVLLWQGGKFLLTQVNASRARSRIVTDTYIELTVGKPSQLNPIFISNNPVDRDIQALVFNKLIWINKEGEPEPELAESWSISSDKKSYVFFLRRDVKWQDGREFSADDVVFTFNTVKNLNSPDSYTSALKGVEITRIDDYSVKCKLPEVNNSFMENISFPIIPMHILKDVPLNEIEFSGFSMAPIGTGPYRLISITQEEAALTKNSEYFLGDPKIKTIRFKFYENADQSETFFELNKGHAISHARKEDFDYFSKMPQVNTISVPIIKRSRVIYLNINSQSEIKDVKFRQALSASINRGPILSKFVGAKGEEATGPINENSWAYSKSATRYANNPEIAKKLLDEAKWTLSADSKYRQRDDTVAEIELTFFDSESTRQLVEEIRKQWEAIGIKTILIPKSFEELSQQIIPTRSYEAMLFEIEASLNPDSYNFWHSSNIDYPGLNISGYKYDRVDILIERGRRATDPELAKKDYELMQNYLLRDVPIIYLYHPSYYYISKTNVKGVNLEKICTPEDRFRDVQNWEIK